MGTAIIFIILIIIIFYAYQRSRQHMQGNSSCCGGASSLLREHKTLHGPAIFEAEYKIKGMHCENCAIRIERLLQKEDSLVAYADFKTKRLKVTSNKIWDREALQKLLSDTDYQLE